MTTIHANSGRLATVFALLTAALLAACGGGGSGATTVAPPPPTPVAGNLTVSVSPTDGATGVARDSKVILTYASSTNSYASSTGTLSCDGTSITLAQSTDQTTKKVTLAPASVFPYGKTCVTQGTSTATGLDGGASTTVNWRSTFTVEQITCKVGEQPSADGQTCVLVPCPTGTTLTNGVCVPTTAVCVSPKVPAKVGTLNVCATPVGIKVSTWNKVPAGCVETTHDMFAPCWLDFAASPNGVQWVQTPARATGAAVNPINGASNDGPVIFGCYIDKADNTICDPFMVDTGRVFANGGVNYTTAYRTFKSDWAVGSQNGIIRHYTPSNTCNDLTWFPPTAQTGVSSNIWDNIPVTCPVL